MIYNLFSFLELNLPGERIFINVMDNVFPTGDIPDRAILITETGESEGIVIDRNSFQIKVRDIDQVRARELAYSVYNTLQSTKKIGGRFGQFFPSVTVNGKYYKEVQTAQIKALAKPQSLGYDENGRAEFSMNFLIYS
jgi:hypothetical protein